MQNDQLAAPIMLRFPSLMENERTSGRRYPRAKEKDLPYSDAKKHEKLDARTQKEVETEESEEDGTETEEAQSAIDETVDAEKRGI